MPPGPFLPGLVKLVASGPISDQDRWSNQFFVDDNQALTQTRANTLANNLEALYNNFEDRLVDYWQLDAIRVYDLSAADQPAYDAVITGVLGTSTAACFQQIAHVITWETGNPGRKFRGRTYLCGIANDQYTQTGTGPLLLDDSTPVAAILDGCEAYYDAMVADGAIPVVYSRVGTGLSSAIISARVGNVPDTQRRRRDQLIESYDSRVF